MMRSDFEIMPARPAFARWLSQTNDVTKTFLSAGQIPDLINMAGGLPDPVVWPVDALAGLAETAVRDHATEALAYSPIDGLPALRRAVAKRFSTDRMLLSPENVLITTAGMQALDLLGKVLLEEGQVIAAQAPTYLGALDAWRSRLPLVRRMQLEANSFDAEAAFAGAQFAYTVPNFSNPSGRLVGLDQRRALVAAAHATGTWLVEDDPYGTLYYDTAPLPRLLSLSGEMAAGGGTAGPYDGPVIYMGTLSKELAPGLRVGWVIAAPQMIAAMTAAKQGSDMCTSGLCQRMALDALDSGLPERILPDVLALYRGRRDALCAAMAQHLGGLFDFQKPSGGMFVWATAKDARVDTDALLKAGLARGVCISPGSVFDPEGRDRRSIRVNFTFNAEDRLAEGVRRLALAMGDLGYV